MHLWCVRVFLSVCTSRVHLWCVCADRWLHVCVYIYIYVSLRLRVQNAVSAQPCVGKLGISLVLLNFLDCNFRLWFETQ